MIQFIGFSRTVQGSIFKFDLAIFELLKLKFLWCIAGLGRVVHILNDILELSQFGYDHCK
jgi:hypothetical protein